MDLHLREYKIAIIGLGYVGLPLAVAFAYKYKVVGFDINLQRIDELKKFNDRTLEISDEQLQNVIVSDENYINDNFATGLYTTTNASDLQNCNFYIVTVPTPTDKYNRPVLTPLITSMPHISISLCPCSGFNPVVSVSKTNILTIII